jgi:hypothetical protein
MAVTFDWPNSKGGTMGKRRRCSGAVVLRPGKQAQRGRARQEREGVLVVIEHDGTVELFGRRDRLRVHIACRIACPIESTEQRLLTEEILELRLPSWARELYLPVNRLAIGSITECRWPDEEIERLEVLDWLKKLDGWKSKWTASK